MKKFFILSLFVTLLFSCSLDDDNTNFNIEILPIESVDIPDEFTLGEVYPITVTYERPSNCHVFREFYYAKHNNERTVAVVNNVFEQNDCVDLTDTTLTATFDFQVTSNGSYIFKFWQGKDENDEDIYLEIEVPVTN
ncbi:hypothetical protein CLV33_103136 [Jejuia pallidilutea]|uniref:Lipoprotein n=1 Tax=Jejuia pallidilutea TaxID=504487 RepID=A0A362X177_9FLAO|nr:hypothetical protein [Jejuia pallidilutea]PQV49503.1 hypothetical protein CLV33_103136 [Jejuia pallidilutea]